MSESSPSPTLNVPALLQAFAQLNRGDFTTRLDAADGDAVASAFNSHAARCQQFATETTRVMREIGTEGRYGGQIEVDETAGSWGDMVEGVNTMSANLTNQLRSMFRFSTAIANGDFSQQITAAANGEMCEMYDTLHIMVANLAYSSASCGASPARRASKASLADRRRYAARRVSGVR